MGLENITSLHDLNVALKNTLDQIHTNSATITVGWASREFTLLLKDNTQVTVKMTEILAKFQELADKANASPQNEILIGDVCDRIVELDFEGDVKLKQKGSISIGLRDFFNLFQTSHTSVIDDIEGKYLFKKNYRIGEKKDDFLALRNDSGDKYKKILIEALNDSEKLTITVNALRSIVRTHPEKAKEILNELKSILDKIDPSAPNPNEEIEAMKHFLDALTIDVNSRGLFRDDEITRRAKGQQSSTKPKRSPQAPDFEKLKTYEDGENAYEWIPEEFAVKFTYDNSIDRKEQKQKMEIEITDASKKSLYEQPPVQLTEINPSNELSQTSFTLKLNNDAIFFLLGKGLSKMQFNVFLCQKIWDDIEKKYNSGGGYESLESQIKAEQLKLLFAMIEKFNDKIIEEFFKNNKIDLTNKHFYLASGNGPSRLASRLKKVKPALFANLMTELKTKAPDKYNILTTIP